MKKKPKTEKSSTSNLRIRLKAKSLKAHSIVSNVNDLYTYQQALYEGNLLSQSLTEMKQRIDIPKPYASQRQSGLGLFFWQSPKGEALCNSGGQYGYRAFMAYFPDHKASYILITNSSMVENGELLLETNRQIVEIIL
jgi:hypothetical protein